MYKNKFFEKIGYKRSMYKETIHGLKDDKRNKQWKKERKKYGGWDSRCGWSLDTLIVESLYTWLNIYLKHASKIVNLDYHTFSITDPETGKTETKTQKECIKLMLSKLKFVLKNNDEYDVEMKKTIHDTMRYVFYILGEVFPSLWW